VLIGRPYLWGLAAAGQDGVCDVVAAIRAQFDRTLAMIGCESAAALDRSYVDAPAPWFAFGEERTRADVRLPRDREHTT
jgi:lactate 2-monooxygenase